LLEAGSALKKRNRLYSFQTPISIDPMEAFRLICQVFDVAFIKMPTTTEASVTALVHVVLYGGVSGFGEFANF